jgi:hypothetical protein
MSDRLTRSLVKFFTVARTPKSKHGERRLIASARALAPEVDARKCSQIKRQRVLGLDIGCLADAVPQLPRREPQRSHRSGFDYDRISCSIRI